ncbi:hypothetical protein [Lactiplantibacillus daowaiensis]|uniref:Uncharacterized protein n=1 Tax=Lactiplantibacillus daowaiensis TaxID=2559918 RepID=A0ABW1S1N8_9LACO|nr:hypothetical protein [Lactiplantibacillus daowaiensis]
MKFNKQFYRSIDFWLALFIFAISIKDTLQPSFSSLNWYVQTAFVIVSIIIMIQALFFKRQA